MHRPPQQSSILSELPDEAYSSVPDSAVSSWVEGQSSFSGWLAIGSLILITTICIAAGPGKVLNILFPAWSFIVGIFLYLRHPILYNGYIWWIWFLVALVRRLSDFKGGYTDSSPILLSPYLVSFISIITVFKRLSKTREDESIPFILPIFATFYGLLIGLLSKSSFEVFRGFLDWAAPLLVAFHLFVNWRLYPHYRRNTQQVFLWGVLIMSVYAVMQFLELPEWDLVWLKESGMESATGAAEEGGVRVWGTMHSPEPFAAVLAGGLLVLLSCTGGAGIPVSVVGYLAILVCRVRSGWIGWAAGLLSFFGSLKITSQLRLLAIGGILLACVLPLMAMPDFADKIGTRLDTLGNLENDGSAGGRQDLFNAEIGKALVSFIGEGLGRDSMDNTILAMLLYIGWIGTLPYMTGLILAVVRMFQTPTSSKDLFATVARGVVMSTIVRIPVNGPHLGPSGAMMWSFLALALAAERYRIYEANLRLAEEVDYLAQLESEEKDRYLDPYLN